MEENRCILLNFSACFSGLCFASWQRWPFMNGSTIKLLIGGKENEKTPLLHLYKPGQVRRRAAPIVGASWRAGYLPRTRCDH
jgi:hypothetical protein